MSTYTIITTPNTITGYSIDEVDERGHHYTWPITEFDDDGTTLVLPEGHAGGWRYKKIHLVEAAGGRLELKDRPERHVKGSKEMMREYQALIRSRMEAIGIPQEHIKFIIEGPQETPEQKRERQIREKLASLQKELDVIEARKVTNINIEDTSDPYDDPDYELGELDD